jgi:hypothetical protein
MQIDLRKFVPVLSGVLIGLACAAQAVHGGAAYGDFDEVIDGWDSAVAYGDVFEWQDVFAAIGAAEDENGQDLYQLVRNKLLIQPDTDAVEAVAQSYGLTKEEFEGIRNGGIENIYYDSSTKGSSLAGGRLSQQEMIDKAETIMNDFNDFKEIFELQQEIDTAVTPSELFSNGNLEDSGFDLIEDLSIIEYILFMEDTDTTIGAPFEDAMDSPVTPNKNPTQYNASAGDVSSETQFSETQDGMIANIELGASGSNPVEIKADVLDEDICPDDESGYADLINAYESKQAIGDGDDDDDNAGDDDDDNDDDNAGDDDDDDYVTAADPSEWGSTFCPAFNAPAEGGSPGLLSFGGSPYQEADGASTELSIRVPLCITFETVMDTARSKSSSETGCIQCEIEAINALFEETLRHSLVPNKATGNYLESAKCKDTLTQLPLDMQIIAIASPVMTPPNDDISFGDNVLDEWNHFIDKSQPVDLKSLGVGILSGDGIYETDVYGRAVLNDDYVYDDHVYVVSKADENYLEEFVLAAVPDGVSTIDLLVKVEVDKAKARGDALNIAKNIGYAAQAMHGQAYSSALFPEMQQMASFFEKFSLIYYNKSDQMEDIVQSCKGIVSKPDIQ